MNSPVQVQSCPKCGSPATDLVDVDAGMRLILQQNSSVGELPGKVCGACYNMLTNQVSQGVKLRLEHQAKEKNRHMMWKSRVNLVKHARQMMQNKAYSEAAVSYEKYLRVLEISYDLKPGELSPEVFGKSQRSRELTVVATTYWDLMRIYDTNPNYRDRMMASARKLAEFAPYSPILPDVVKKAQAFVSYAKNPDIVREFLKLCKAGSGRCFIATSAFESSYDPVIVDLRRFRDFNLRPLPFGDRLVSFYYRTSPYIAEYLDRHPRLKPFVRFCLRKFARFVA